MFLNDSSLRIKDYSILLINLFSFLWDKAVGFVVSFLFRVSFCFAIFSIYSERFLNEATLFYLIYWLIFKSSFSKSTNFMNRKLQETPGICYSFLLGIKGSRTAHRRSRIFRDRVVSICT